MINSAISEAMDRSFGIVKKYIDDKGEVRLVKGANYCLVSVIKRLGPGHEIHRDRGRLSALSAKEFFEVACRYVRDEIEWTEPVREFSCKYNPKKSRSCTDENCPKKLGGQDYREIFGGVCPYRKSRTR